MKKKQFDVSALPRVNDDKRFIAEVEKGEALQRRLQDVKRQIVEAGKAGPGIDEQAARVAAGEDIEVQTAEPLEKLHQERRIIEKAIQIDNVRHEAIARTIAGEITKTMAPQVEQMARDLQAQCDQLIDAVDQRQQFFQDLARLGIGVKRRPGSWSVPEFLLRIKPQLKNWSGEYFFGAWGFKSKFNKYSTTGT